MELEIYEALTSAGVSAEKAKNVAESIDKAIDRRYEVHARQLATRGDLADLGANVRRDLAEVETRLTQTIADMQRWTIGAVFAGMAASAAIMKLWQ